MQTKQVRSFHKLTIQKFSYRLAAACAGRETHSELFSIAVVGTRFGTNVVWEDCATGDKGWIGSLQEPELVPVCDALFTQLRTWRTRCEVVAGALPAKAKAVRA